MEYAKNKLGFYITEYDEVNSRGELNSLADLQGINNEKYFQECQSNKNDIELNRYRICRKGMFSYNKATSRNGEKISIAYRSGPDCLVSPSYHCFSIKDESLLTHEYLMMWFSRPEFDRYARFHSWGSATEFFTFESMCETEINVPSLSFQKQAVQEYNILNSRIKNIEKQLIKLEQVAMNLYKDWFVSFSHFGGKKPEEWKKENLGDFVEIKRGGSPRPIDEYLSTDGYRWLKISDATESDSPYILKIKEHIKKTGISRTVHLEAGNLVLSNSATPGLPKILDVDTCIHDGWLYFPNLALPRNFMYLYFKNERDKLVSNANGSIFLNLKIDIVNKFPIVIPDKNTLDSFSNIIDPLFNHMLSLTRELYALKKALKVLLIRIS